MFNGTSFGFVNSHLTSGSEKKLRWGESYTFQSIFKKFELIGNIIETYTTYIYTGFLGSKLTFEGNYANNHDWFAFS